MTPIELRAMIANIVTELDTIIDNREDVLPQTAALVNQAANYLAQAYVSIPGRFSTTESSGE